jgi:probable blue pigment (indigoidine) exporter
VPRALPDPRSVLVYLFMVTAWGVNYPVVRAMTSDGGPFWLATTRAGIGGLAALALLAIPGETGHLTWRDRRDAILIGLLNTGGFYGLWFAAASMVPPGETSVLIYTFPLQVAVLAVPVLGYRPGRTEIGALLGGLAGIVLVTQPWQGGLLDVVGIALLLVAAFCWGVGTVLYQYRFRGPQLREGNPYQLLGGAGLTLLVAALWEPSGVPAPTGAFWLDALYLGVVGTALAYAAWFSLLSRIPAATLSSFTFLVPVVAISASAIVTGERLDAVQLAGVALVAISLYALGRNRRSGSPLGSGTPGDQQMSGPSPLGK